MIRCFVCGQDIDIPRHVELEGTILSEHGAIALHLECCEQHMKQLRAAMLEFTSLLVDSSARTGATNLG